MKHKYTEGDRDYYIAGIYDMLHPAPTERIVGVYDMMKRAEFLAKQKEFERREWEKQNGGK